VQKTSKNRRVFFSRYLAANDGPGGPRHNEWWGTDECSQRQTGTNSRVPRVVQFRELIVSLKDDCCVQQHGSGYAQLQSV